YDSSSGLGSWDFILNAKEIGDNLGLKQVTGVELAPINTFHEYEDKYKDNNTYWINQFLTSSPDDYNEFYGGPGTYLIYESRSPQGYDLAGTLMMPMGETYTFETTNLQTGIVVQLWFGEGNTRHMVMPGGSEINGDETGKDTILLTDQNTMEKVPVELKSNAGAGNIIIEEKPQTIRLWSSATSVDTGTQWADPDNTGIRLQDDVFVQTFPEKEARYIVDTRLYDKTAGRFVSFNSSNAHSYEGTKVEEIRIPEGFWSVFPNGGAAGTVGDAENGIITTEFNTRTSIEPGQTYEFKVNCSVDGTQNGGLAGHTLVFVNVVTVLNGYKGDIPIGGGAYAPAMGPDVIGYDAALIYQYPTIRIDTDKLVLKLDDNAVDNPGGEDEERTGTNQKEYMSQLETMKQDSAEYIHLTRSQTSILSAQTKRKGGTGESIIYAGMYLDDSFTSGGGAVKQTLTDTIEYENLQPDKTYYVRGYLVDRETGNPAVDANGTPIQNTENTIKQQASSTGKGEWNITYSFDATGCGNRVYVSFVEVYIGDELVLEYKQLDDPLEAFYIPEITTKAWDNKTGTDVTYAEETVKVHDTITYRKLMPGTKYKIEFRLVNMETGVWDGCTYGGWGFERRGEELFKGSYQQWFRILVCKNEIWSRWDKALIL
ncbi:MAG: VaFE repeat-containing surface-anchored protein, partial [Lachnospiraceae bacterium]|nr:VaFE repeat-containing surface-anchored protein [Lachnospiraceae bacterium]